MPSFLSRGEKKYTTSEANQNRFITKIRWIVEGVNGRVKQFKYFDKVILNSSLAYVHDYFLIVCAILNAIDSPLVHATDNEAELARLMFK